jgi:hypothetical protein
MTSWAAKSHYDITNGCMVLDLRLLNIAEFLAGAYPKPSLETERRSR